MMMRSITAVLVATTLAVLSSVSGAQAQCATAGVTVMNLSPGVWVEKTLTGKASTVTCTPTASTGVASCGWDTRGGGAGNCGQPASKACLLVYGIHAATGPGVRACHFSCNCGSVVLDNSDGLPVELLGFAVD